MTALEYYALAIFKEGRAVKSPEVFIKSNFYVVNVYKK